MAAASATALGVSATPLLLAMAYLFSYGAYMMNRSTDMGTDSVSHPDRTAHLGSRRRYLPAIAGLAFATGYALALTVNLVFFLALLAPLVFALAYSVGSKRLVRIIGVSKLKDKLLVKNLFVSLGWSLVPVLVGFYYLKFTPVIFWLGGFIFLRLMVNTLIFDVRDIEGDRKEGIRTVPVVYGSARTYRVMAVMDIASLALVSAAVTLGALPGASLMLAILPFYSLGYAALARRPGANLSTICDVVVDGEYLVWGPLMLIGAAVF